jgi:hypothetical protein
MPTALPARNIFDGSSAPATSTMKSALGSLRDFLSDLLGATGSVMDARAALSIPALSEIAGFGTGCGLSTAGGSTTMTIQPGAWLDSTNAKMLVLSSVYTKTTAAWAVGSTSGGWARAGAAGASTVAHWYLIRRPDTGVVDVCASLSATGLVAADYAAGGGNIPAAYTQFRRIASWFVDGAAKWYQIYQRGDRFIFALPLTDYSTAVGVTTAITFAASVPSGNKYEWFGGIRYALSDYVVLSDPDTPDNAAGIYNAQLSTNGAGGGFVSGIFTNSSAQLRVRLNAGGGGVLNVTTHGWVDTRGRSS